MDNRSINCAVPVCFRAIWNGLVLYAPVQLIRSLVCTLDAWSGSNNRCSNYHHSRFGDIAKWRANQWCSGSMTMRRLFIFLLWLVCVRNSKHRTVNHIHFLICFDPTPAQCTASGDSPNATVNIWMSRRWSIEKWLMIYVAWNSGKQTHSRVPATRENHRLFHQKIITTEKWRR